MTNLNADMVDGVHASSFGQNVFKTVNCPSGTDPVADSPTDTLNLTAGAHMVVTGTSGTDTVDFAVSTGNSGTVIPLLNGANTWSGVQTFSLVTKQQFRDTANFIYSPVANILSVTAGTNLFLDSGFSVIMRVSLTTEAILSSTGLDIVNTCSAEKFVSDIAIGTSPYACTSTTLNTNLNADQVDGKDSTDLLLVDGSQALSANWDAGAFEIRALTFQSDQATGTAPFTVASTTMVTNLNADQVDGLHASAFATAAATLTDNSLIRGDGGGQGVQDSGILLDDSDNMLLPTNTEMRFRAATQKVYSSAVNILSLSGGTRLDFELAGTAKVALTFGLFWPVTTNDIDLGNASNKFKDAFFSGEVLANTFQSDVATGTAPLTVASTTVVTNLNASLLEGNAASAFLTTVPTGTVIQDQVNDTPTSHTVSADPVMALVLSTTTGVASCVYMAEGVLQGSGNSQDSWTIEIQDPSNVTIKTITIAQDATGTGDFWHIPFKLTGRDPTPATGATGYHLKLTEDSGAGTLVVKSAYLYRVAS